MSFFFDGFGGGFGGGHHHFHDSSSSRKKDVDSEQLYKVLGLTKSATTNDVKKAYRNLAKTHHPDKGGDAEKFKEITKAYEILSDEEKKKLYDEGGLDAVENGGGGGGGVDIFDIIGGGGGRRGGQKRKGEDVQFPLQVSLEELYNGVTKKLKLTRNIICKDCNGRGSSNPNSTDTCKDCKGRGIRVVVRQLGPGMIQQMQTQCDKCQGEGSVISEKDRCNSCAGMKTTKEKKTLEVFVTKGMKHGEKITFKGEADQSPNTLTGDVVVVLKLKEHPVFKRDNANLFMKKVISLQQALCGFEFVIHHLDGRQLRIKSAENSVCTPGSFKAIKDEGMPNVKNPFVKGKLYIQFDVEFPQPSQLSKQAKEELTKILPPLSKASSSTYIPPASTSSESTSSESMNESETSTEQKNSEPEEVVLIDVDMESEKQAEQNNREAYDEDDERPRGQHGTCRTQ